MTADAQYRQHSALSMMGFSLVSLCPEITLCAGSEKQIHAPASGSQAWRMLCYVLNYYFLLPGVLAARRDHGQPAVLVSNGYLAVSIVRERANTHWYTALLNQPPDCPGMPCWILLKRLSWRTAVDPDIMVPLRFEHQVRNQNRCDLL